MSVIEVPRTSEERPRTSEERPRTSEERLAYNEAHAVYKAAGLKQKAHIPSKRQGEVRSLESERTGTNQSVDPNELVLIDVEGNPYPKWASQFVTQFKPDPEDVRSEGFFNQVQARYRRWL